MGSLKAIGKGIETDAVSVIMVLFCHSIKVPSGAVTRMSTACLPAAPGMETLSSETEPLAAFSGMLRAGGIGWSQAMAKHDALFGRREVVNSEARPRYCLVFRS